MLKEAGIERARGVVTCLRDDRDNAFVVLTAKNMRQDLYAVARANEDVAEKVRRAGADMVVSPNYIGGLRLASLFVRPSAVTFLDRMMRDPEFTWRIEDLHISECSQIRDVSIRDSGISNYDILVLAIRRAGKRSFIFKPNAGEVIHKGDTRSDGGTRQSQEIARHLQSRTQHGVKGISGKEKAGRAARRFL
ncbi:MAG: NAD-binding protein [Planctomycetota bacterium]|nr:NAD-binding protein [Planctomycetota bacterium]